MTDDERSKRACAIAIARQLDMEPIPVEGGYFAPTFRSIDEIESPERLGGGARVVVSAIYFMMYKDFSAWHRLRAHEIWCHHSGGRLTLYELKEDGLMVTHSLGDVLENAGNRPQVAIEAGSWMAGRLEDDEDYVLVSCCVSPGFESVDCEFPDLEAICARYPEHETVLRKFARVKPNSTETDLDYTSPQLFPRD